MDLCVVGVDVSPWNPPGRKTCRGGTPRGTSTEGMAVWLGNPGVQLLPRGVWLCGMGVE
jgi:hypothetical protein